MGVRLKQKKKEKRKREYTARGRYTQHRVKIRRCSRTRACPRKKIFTAILFIPPLYAFYFRVPPPLSLPPRRAALLSLSLSLSLFISLLICISAQAPRGRGPPPSRAPLSFLASKFSAIFPANPRSRASPPTHPTPPPPATALFLSRLYSTCFCKSPPLTFRLYYFVGASFPPLRFSPFFLLAPCRPP